MLKPALVLLACAALPGGVILSAQAPVAPTSASGSAVMVPASTTPVAGESGAAAAVLETAPTPGLTPHGYSYVPAGRRDPFVSLLRRGVDSEGVEPGPRPRGLAGLRAAEVTLRGTVESHGGYVGLLRGADTRTYVVRPGDQLADGTIQAITPDSVVILQQVHDPVSRERQREVRKVLRPSDEARR